MYNRFRMRAATTLKAVALQKLPTTRPTHFVCAWCDQPIGGKPNAAPTEANYGMCPPCLQRELSALRTADPRHVTAA